MNLRMSAFLAIFCCLGFTIPKVSANFSGGGGSGVPTFIDQDQPFYDCASNIADVNYNRLRIEASNELLQATGGAIIVLLPAQYTHAGDHSSSDGLPDTGYDLATIIADPNHVKCPQNNSEFTFAPAQIIAAGDSGFNQGGKYYHQIRCEFITNDSQPHHLVFSDDPDVGNPIIIDKLINPTCSGNEQMANIFAYLKLNNADDGQSLQIASLSKDTQIHASIAKRFSFTISGTAAGKNICGLTTDRTSLANKLDFGTVTAKKFSQAAHQLEIDTNSPGYAIILSSDDQMRQESTLGATVCPGDGAASDVCLPNAQVPGMSEQQSAPWNNIDQSGLGYTQELMQADDLAVLRFNHLNGYRHFADSADSQTPVLILHTLAGTQSSSYLCYRLVAKPTNLNGIYKNQLTYSAYPLF